MSQKGDAKESKRFYTPLLTSHAVHRRCHISFHSETSSGFGLKRSGILNLCPVLFGSSTSDLGFSHMLSVK